ncbi:MAG: entericidin A/B family lipoprotein [Phycisphaerales bacterium]|nr:entericidin A/B family lipoprotein [Phycisphaerales bacterium]
MKTFTRRLALPLAALLFVAGVSAFMPACETVKGAGKDVQNAGEAGERAIDGK